MSKRKKKKEKFIKGKKRKDQSNTLKFVLASAAAIMALVALVFILRPSDQGVGEKIDANVSYEGETVEMKDITAQVEGGKIIVPLKEVKDNKLVYFEHQGTQAVPLLAYLSPSGRVVAAVSMCEPCKSTRFHMEGKTLVCNACGTVWDINTLKGISGGCLQYPPDVLEKAKVENDQLIIDAEEVTNWKPRV